MTFEFETPQQNVSRKPRSSLIFRASQGAGAFLRNACASAAEFTGRHPGIALLACCFFMLFGQLWTLKSIVEFESERQVWSLTQAERKLELSSLEKNSRSLLAEISGYSNQLGEMKAEVANAVLERDRSSRELAEVQKQLSLSRDAESEAMRSRQTAIDESQAAVNAKLAAEQRVVELSAEKTKLESEMTTAREQSAPLIKQTDEANVLLAKLNTEIDAARKQLSDGQAQADAIQGKLAEIRTQMVKESESLQSAVTENGQTVRKREELLKEVSVAQQDLEAIKSELEKRKTEMEAIEKDIAELEAMKAELTKSIDDLQKRQEEPQAM